MVAVGVLFTDTPYHGGVTEQRRCKHHLGFIFEQGELFDLLFILVCHPSARLLPFCIRLLVYNLLLFPMFHFLARFVGFCLSLQPRCVSVSVSLQPQNGGVAVSLAVS